jgi:putative FmdB family regulatory protein
MPTYVYACNACGKQFEQVQSFKDAPLRVCPCSQEGTVRRVFQPVGIVFKGSGWYITDSRKSDTASVSASGSNGSEARAESSETKTETTSETKADAPAAAPASAPKSSSETSSIAS